MVSCLRGVDHSPLSPEIYRVLALTNSIQNSFIVWDRLSTIRIQVTVTLSLSLSQSETINHWLLAVVPLSLAQCASTIVSNKWSTKASNKTPGMVGVRGSILFPRVITRGALLSHPNTDKKKQDKQSHDLDIQRATLLRANARVSSLDGAIRKLGTPLNNRCANTGPTEIRKTKNHRPALTRTQKKCAAHRSPRHTS